MRWLIPILLSASPATGWEATIGEICTLTHAMPEGSVELTYDPRGPLYSITITRGTDLWVDAPLFAMTFDGQRPNTITTDRHILGNGDASLTVADQGFGNVLDGLQFNHTATALTESQSVNIPLDGAAPEVEKFRACADAGLV
jgi:hypothetical protein